jgi:sulfite exporter TauE/SafE
MTFAIVIAALVLGFLGSFHCIGMCGPIALTLPVQHLNGFRKFTGILIYNSGRVFTYAVLGLLFGIIGMSFNLFGWQQILSILLGSLLVLFFISSFFKKRIFKNQFIQKYWNKYIIRWLTPLFHKKNMGNLFLIGLLNGLLPCGLVYMAVAGALATGNIINSSLFMAFFGLGTLPAMITMSFAGGFISLSMRNKIRKSVPYIIGLMGILLILRGMNLNIPYLSPAMSIHHSVEACH